MVKKEMLIADLLTLGEAEKIADTLMQFGMHCLGCAIAHNETLEEAAAVHGIDIDELIDALNKVISE